MIVPCESTHHDKSANHAGPGHVMVRKTSPCGCKIAPPNLVICKGGWDWAGRGGIACSQCNWRGSREDFWEVIRFLDDEE